MFNWLKRMFNMDEDAGRRRMIDRICSRGRPSQQYLGIIYALNHR